MTRKTKALIKLNKAHEVAIGNALITRPTQKAAQKPAQKPAIKRPTAVITGFNGAASNKFNNNEIANVMRSELPRECEVSHCLSLGSAKR